MVDLRVVGEYLGQNNQSVTHLQRKTGKEREEDKKGGKKEEELRRRKGGKKERMECDKVGIWEGQDYKVVRERGEKEEKEGEEGISTLRRGEYVKTYITATPFSKCEFYTCTCM